MSRADQYNRRVLTEGRLTPSQATILTRRFQAEVGLETDGMLGPETQAVLDGWSPIAARSGSPWSGRPRSQSWHGQMYGLVVHTTGSGILRRAARNGIDPVTQAVLWYENSKGTHYVIGYQGEIIQVASEHQLAYGVGMRDQRAAEDAPGGWESRLSADLVSRWRQRWTRLRIDRPSELFPGAEANTCYIHAEMPPLPEAQRGSGAADGLWYTAAQHEAVARLASDIARRNNFSGVPVWWRSSRIVGHEDLAPINRPGWDPGWLRAEPRFDWTIVYAEVESLCAAEVPLVGNLTSNAIR